jgi:polysaccharide export outer membrane protein
MKKLLYLALILLLTECTSQKKLAYLGNLPETPEPQTFQSALTDYKVQQHDILYIDVKTQTPDGKIENILQGNNGIAMNNAQSESGQYLLGYTVDEDGYITLPVIGRIDVAGKKLSEIKDVVQKTVDSVINHSFVDVKLLSFKYTVLGEAENPGVYSNYNDYITVLEAIGRAGGIGDYGHRDRVLVVRTTPEGTKTFRINLQDKAILSSEAYYLVPNDVIIIEPTRQKILSQNLPTISFIVSTLTGVVTTTLLLINYFGK